MKQAFDELLKNAVKQLRINRDKAKFSINKSS